MGILVQLCAIMGSFFFIRFNSLSCMGLHSSIQSYWFGLVSPSLMQLRSSSFFAELCKFRLDQYALSRMP